MSRRCSPSVTMSTPASSCSAQHVQHGRVGHARRTSPRELVRRRWCARMGAQQLRRARPAADGGDREERQGAHARRLAREEACLVDRLPSSGTEAAGAARAARPSALPGPSSRGAPGCRSSSRTARRASAARVGRRSPARTVKMQWSKRSVVASDPVTRSASSVPSADPALPVQVEHRRRRRSRPLAGTRRASRSPPMWSPCLPTSTSKRRTVKVALRARARAAAAGRAGSASPAASRCAPVATVLPRRSASVCDRRCRGARQVRDAVAVGVAHGDGPAACRRERRWASSQASGEFQAIWICAGQQRLDQQLIVAVEDVRRSGSPAPRRSR